MPLWDHWTSDALTPQHKAELLRDSSISAEVIAARRYRSILRPATRTDGPTSPALGEYNALRRIGFSKALLEYEDSNKYWPMLYVPLYNFAGGPRGTAQLKPHVPFVRSNGKQVKYVNPSKRPISLDLNPLSRDRIMDPKQAIWLIEGIKKADSLTSRGRCAVGLSGLWNWRSGGRAHQEWEEIDVRGRVVIVCGDRDALVRPHLALAMRRCGWLMRSRGAREVLYLIPPMLDGKEYKGVDDFFAAGGTLEALREACTTHAPDPRRMDDRFLNGYLVDTFALEALEGQYYWDAVAKEWLQWVGSRWAPGHDESVIEEARLWAIDGHQEALSAHRADPKNNDYEEWSRILRNNNGWKSLAEGARGIRIIDRALFDRQPDRLNVLNGVVDLCTGELSEHNPEDLMIRRTDVEYDPTATHPSWDKALEAIPAETRDWFQLRVGQAAWGEIPQDAGIIFMIGSGRNGKSTIKDALASALGDYYAPVSERLLIPPGHSVIPVELMSLIGARMVVVDETPESRRLDIQRVKMLTGNKQMSIRAMRTKNEIVFPATHSIFVSTNYRPMVEESDSGTWERLIPIVFPYRFRIEAEGQELEGPMDRWGERGLQTACGNNPAIHRAVLRWIIDGAIRYGRDGLGDLPSSVLHARRDWRMASDVVYEYVTEYLEVTDDPTDCVPSGVLYGHFSEWLAQQGKRPWSHKLMSERLMQTSTFSTQGIKPTLLSNSSYLRVSLGRDVGSNFKLPLRFRGWARVRFRSDMSGMN